jgi:hypothetical protein
MNTTGTMRTVSTLGRDRLRRKMRETAPVVITELHFPDMPAPAHMRAMLSSTGCQRTGATQVHTDLKMPVPAMRSSSCSMSIANRDCWNETVRKCCSPGADVGQLQLRSKSAHRDTRAHTHAHTNMHIQACSAKARGGGGEARQAMG